MDHVYFSDGTEKRISWVIQNNETQVEQYREQTDIYLDKVSIEQAKYIALHVGIFWGVGRFIIKNDDSVKVMVDSRSMFDRLVDKKTSSDPFIESRIGFIRQIIDQRKLVVKYELIEPQQNIATKVLSS
ncbi:MAG TPA: hypothetical protein VLB45_01255 [Nitrosopumilaceae archaeon]|nr:hypothetical protein [Nitrosopumilaceae archaeon]